MEESEKNKESMTEKRNQRELLWFQTGGALNFITAAPHCGVVYNVLVQDYIPQNESISANTSRTLYDTARSNTMTIKSYKGVDKPKLIISFLYLQ
jgi:hypothetical protein